MNVFFAMLGLDSSDAKTLFQLLDQDEEDEEVKIEEFVHGCLRLKGYAKSIDLAQGLYQLRAIMRDLYMMNSILQRVYPEHFQEVHRVTKTMSFSVFGEGPTRPVLSADLHTNQTHEGQMYSQLLHVSSDKVDKILEDGQSSQLVPDQVALEIVSSTAGGEPRELLQNAVLEVDVDKVIEYRESKMRDCEQSALPLADGKFGSELDPEVTPFLPLCREATGASSQSERRQALL